MTSSSRSRPSVVDRSEFFYRFGEKEREAINAFNFLDDLSSSSCPSSPIKGTSFDDPFPYSFTESPSTTTATPVRSFSWSSNLTAKARMRSRSRSRDNSSNLSDYYYQPRHHSHSQTPPGDHDFMIYSPFHSPYHEHYNQVSFKDPWNHHQSTAHHQGKSFLGEMFHCQFMDFV
jgi:hypothetical protein